MSSYPKHSTGGVLLTTGSLIMLGGAGLFGWQVLVWLKYSSWIAVSVRRGFLYAQIPEPGIKWLGLQKLWEQVAGAPLAVCLLVFGAVVAFIGSHLAERAFAARRVRDLRRSARKLRS